MEAPSTARPFQASSGATIDFSATAKYNGISLYADDTSFTWELTGDIGTIDENGLFTAAETYESKSGVLKVSCGNAYSTVNLTVGAKEAIMTDMQNHWAREPVEALYTQGILTGACDKEGNLVFRPDDNMTRQEFMVALIRALGIDTAQYDAIALPFDDQDQIADWALPPFVRPMQTGISTAAPPAASFWQSPRVPSPVRRP